MTWVPRRETQAPHPHETTKLCRLFISGLSHLPKLILDTAIASPSIKDCVKHGTIHKDLTDALPDPSVPSRLCETRPIHILNDDSNKFFGFPSALHDTSTHLIGTFLPIETRWC